jgi:hypothetical protein
MLPIMINSIGATARVTSSHVVRRAIDGATQ